MRPPPPTLFFPSSVRDKSEDESEVEAEADGAFTADAAARSEARKMILEFAFILMKRSEMIGH